MLHINRRRREEGRAMYTVALMREDKDSRVSKSRGL